MPTVLITGGTGLIGTALSKALIAKGYDVIIFTRRIKSAIENPQSSIQYATWNVEQQTINETAIQQADFIIHLAGANIAEKRWTKARKREIVESRTKSSQLLVNALKETPNKVQAVISASAIGWYGINDNNSKPFVETDPPARNFLGETCRQWEASIEPVKDLDKRLVKLRTGIVLSNNGGAYPEFKKSFKFGVAAILGSGKQIISWIHIEDLVNLYIHAIENNMMKGVYNAVAPHPVSNKELILQIANAKKGIFIPVHVPEFFLKAILGEMGVEVLKTATVSSEKIQQAGFVFQYPTVEKAILQLEGS
ncbi:MAG: TIGR01777 family protein [Chitinophagaceae bacterium]|nr:TIGR01777 family protein [Chitinophagaceae bacterium]